jgi:predicted RNA-binding protein with PIN domain
MKRFARKILIVDGYNLIHAAPHRFQKMTKLENRRSHLLKIINSSGSLPYDKIIVVFDGQLSNLPNVKESEGKVVEIYSGKHQEADQVIQELIRKESQNSQLKIVSSDHKIRNTARDHLVQVISSQQFWQSLSPTEQKKRGTSEGSSVSDRQLSDKEVKEWLKLFKSRSENDDKY